MGVKEDHVTKGRERGVSVYCVVDDKWGGEHVPMCTATFCRTWTCVSSDGSSRGVGNGFISIFGRAREGDTVEEPMTGFPTGLVCANYVCVDHEDRESVAEGDGGVGRCDRYGGLGCYLCEWMGVMID